MELDKKDFLISLIIFYLAFALFVRSIDYGNRLTTLTAVLAYSVPMLYYFKKHKMKETENLIVSTLFGIVSYLGFFLFMLKDTLVGIVSCTQVTLLSIPYAIIESFTGSSGVIFIGLVVTAIIVGQMAGFFWMLLSDDKKEESD